MKKEGDTGISRELEKKAFNKMILFAGLSGFGTVLACANPVCAIPTLFCYGALVASFRNYENLTK